jgi:hypothetical protein
MLRGLIRLGLLLAPRLTPLSHATNHAAGGCPNGCPFARIAGDGTADGTGSRPSGSSPEDTPLGRRRRRHTGLYPRGINAGLLDSPNMAVIAVARLLLCALSLVGVDIKLAPKSWNLSDEADPQQRQTENTLSYRVEHAPISPQVSSPSPPTLPLIYVSNRHPRPAWKSVTTPTAIG